MRRSRSVAIVRASSQLISANSPEPRGPILFNGAEHAAIDGVISVALDVAKCAVPQMDFDAAATSAHVARRVRNLVTDWLRIFYVVSWHRSLMVSSTAVDTKLHWAAIPPSIESDRGRVANDGYSTACFTSRPR